MSSVVSQKIETVEGGLYGSFHYFQKNIDMLKDHTVADITFNGKKPSTRKVCFDNTSKDYDGMSNVYYHLEIIIKQYQNYNIQSLDDMMMICGMNIHLVESLTHILTDALKRLFRVIHNNEWVPLCMNGALSGNMINYTHISSFIFILELLKELSSYITFCMYHA